MKKDVIMRGNTPGGLASSRLPDGGETGGRVAWRGGPRSRFQPVSDRFPALEEQEAVFSFFAPDAKKVSVAGDFNNWSPDATPMINTGTGEWVVVLTLRSGQYEYRFVIDGHWCEDPRAPQRAANPYGGFNSVLLEPLADKTFFL